MSSRRAFRAFLGSWRRRPDCVAEIEGDLSANPAPAVPDIEFSSCCRQAIRLLRRRGAEWPIADYLQFGVGRGASIACVYHALEAEGLWHVRLFGFEPSEDASGDAACPPHRPEAFRALLQSTDRYLRRSGVNWARITLTRGDFRQTLVPELRERLRIEGASMVLIASKRYETTLAALRFCEPLMRDQTVLFLDGYETAEGIGQRLAFGEFIARCPHFSVVQLPTYAARARVVLVGRKEGCDAARLAVEACAGNAA